MTGSLIVWRSSLHLHISAIFYPSFFEDLFTSEKPQEEKSDRGAEEFRGTDRSSHEGGGGWWSFKIIYKFILQTLGRYWFVKK
jgi:hypothetical protein